MPEYAANGLMLRWFDQRRDARGGTSGHTDALPASPGNATRLIYPINGGPERGGRGSQTAPEPGTGAQRFAADLPQVRPGDNLAWRPVLSNGVRNAAPGLQPPAQKAVPTVRRTAPRDGSPALSL